MDKVIFSLDTGWSQPSIEATQFIKNLFKAKGIPFEMGEARFSHPRMFELFVIPAKRWDEITDYVSNINREVFAFEIDRSMNINQLDLFFNTIKQIGTVKSMDKDKAELNQNYFVINGYYYVIENK